jgi:valine--pyruvate aminotransferase
MAGFRLSSFGERYSGRTGILELMDDLSAPPVDPSAPFSMLGGGNPAIIPELSAAWAEALRRIVADPGFPRLVGAYDSPLGPSSFREALAERFAEDYGWPVDARNVGVVNGSQLAAFYLVNMLSGPYSDGRRRKILLPLVPEYIGYADQGLDPGCFVGRRPSIETRGERRFKYRLDLGIADAGSARDAPPIDFTSIGAILVSRPTNPTGNVVTDEEVRALSALARRAGVPLILDNAYGLPFPGIVFGEAQPVWNEDIVLCMSLSKIGLPSLRTGIVVARPELIEALSATNAIASLATGSLGPAIAEGLLRSGELLRLSREVVGPFYKARSARALEIVAEELEGLPWAAHESEGAIFLWLWLQGMPISSKELYLRLKARNVIVLPGEGFFYGLEEDWGHSRECLRLNYSGPEELFRRGIRILGEELRKVYEA